MQQHIINQSFNKDSVLTLPQKEQYNRDGYLILKDFISYAMCSLLVQRANQLIENFEPDAVKTIFSTKDQRHAKQAYFIESASTINFFFEEDAINEQGELKIDKLLSINKIGHALHDVDPVFDCFSRNHKIAQLVKDLNIQHPLLLQSMFICKQPHIGGEVNCHQDSTYLYVKEEPVIGLWFALEDATIENGCLWTIPGGHQTGLKSKMVRNEKNEVNMEIYDDTPWDLEKMIPLEVARGSVIVLNGLLPHMSKANISPHSRNAYTLHIISGLHPYPRDNWLQRKSNMPLRGFI